MTDSPIMQNDSVLAEILFEIRALRRELKSADAEPPAIVNNVQLEPFRPEPQTLRQAYDAYVLEWMAARGITLDACLLGIAAYLSDSLSVQDGVSVKGLTYSAAVKAVVLAYDDFIAEEGYHGAAPACFDEWKEFEGKPLVDAGLSDGSDGDDADSEDIPAQAALRSEFNASALANGVAPTAMKPAADTDSNADASSDDDTADEAEGLPSLKDIAGNSPIETLTKPTSTPYPDIPPIDMDEVNRQLDDMLAALDAPDNATAKSDTTLSQPTVKPSTSRFKLLRPNSKQAPAEPAPSEATSSDPDSNGSSDDGLGDDIPLDAASDATPGFSLPQRRISPSMPPKRR